MEDVARSINKINGSVDMGLKEGVKLSTLTQGGYIGNLGNKGDKVEGVECMERCLLVQLVSQGP